MADYLTAGSTTTATTLTASRSLLFTGCTVLQLTGWMGWVTGGSPVWALVALVGLTGQLASDIYPDDCE